MQAQKFLQPVIDDLKVKFQQAGIPLYPMVTGTRWDDDSKYTLTLVVGRDNEIFDGGRGSAIIQEVSAKHKDHLGLGFCESIGTCADCWGSYTSVNW